MPPDQVHYKIDKLLFGKEFPDVHNHMDRAWNDLGPLHRLVGHRNMDLLLIRQTMGKEKFRSAVIHRRVDRGIIQLLTIPGSIREYRDLRKINNDK